MPHPLRSPPRHRYELCDEFGLYVVDEANIETHHFNRDGYPLSFLADKPEWRSAFLVRAAPPGGMV